MQNNTNIQENNNHKQLHEAPVSQKPTDRGGTLCRQLLSVFHLLLFLAISGLMVYTEGGPSAFLSLGKRKLVMAALAGVIFFILLTAGDRLSTILHRTGICRWLELLLLLGTPLAMFAVVQIIVQLAERKSTASISYLRIIKYAVFDMPVGDFLRNLVIYYFILVLLILLIRKINIACMVYCLLMVLLVLVNYYVTEFRGQAFLLLDAMGMSTAADVAGNYRLDIPIYLGITLLFTVDFSMLQLHFQRLRIPHRLQKKSLHILSQLVVLAVFALSSLYAVVNAANVSFWNTNRSYRNNGYLCALVSQVRYIHPEKPAGYSVGKVQEIGEQVSDSTQSNVTVPQNIIMIMNESLTDFESIGQVKTDREILPFLHSLNRNVKKGQLHVPTFGGGTARTEYEALTGNSMYFLPAGSVPYQLFVHDPESGMAQILKAQGYTTIAVHPNNASNWNRTNVYADMDFDQFISTENWGNDSFDKIRNFASDETTYDKLIKLFERKQSGEKLFTFCVTMQNHGGYGTETLNGYQPDVKLHYNREYPLAETYLSLARESDRAFQKLLSYFEKVDEPTMIIMFGDHWPKIENGFTASVLGKKRSELSLDGTQKTYTTPYVIWTNYPSETVEQDMSSNYLGSYVLSLAGVKLTPYNRFLLDLKDELPIIGIGAVCDTEGTWYSQNNLPEKFQNLVNEYHILEYNNQFDQKHKITDYFSIEYKKDRNECGLFCKKGFLSTILFTELFKLISYELNFRADYNLNRIFTRSDYTGNTG